MNQPNGIDAYIAGFPDSIREILELLRKTIRSAAPGAEEVISYKMPAFKLNGMLVWYAAYEKHIGLYPTASPIQYFNNELTAYKKSKGAIQFPLDKPLPLELITRIVKFKINENQLKSESKIKKK